MDAFDLGELAHQRAQLEIKDSLLAAVAAGVDQLECDTLHPALDIAVDLAAHLRE